MYHTAKRPRRKKRRLGWAFLLLGVWAAALWAAFPAAEPVEAAPVPREPVRVHRREVYTVVLKPETVYTQDSTLLLGREAELFPGAAGELRCTAEVDYLDGLEISRQITEREIIRPMEHRIVAQGTAAHLEAAASNGYLWLPDGRMFTYTHTVTAEVTAFTPNDPGSLPGACYGTVAADPAVIPPGSRLYIVSADGTFLYGPAQATASPSMQGTRIDLCLPTPEEANTFARQTCTVYFLG